MSDVFDRIIEEKTEETGEKDYSTFNTDIEDIDKDEETETEEEEQEGTKPESKSEKVESEKVEKETETKEAEEESGEEDKKKSLDDIPKWMKQLPKSMLMDEEIVEELSEFKNIGELAREYMTLLAGIDEMVYIPDENASEEEIKEFLEKIGVPEDPDEYEIESWKTPDGEEIDAGIRESIVEAMYKAKLSKTQAQYLYKALGNVFLKKVQIEAEEAAEQARDTEEFFRIKWGANFDKNMDAIIETIQKFGGPELVDEIDKSGLGNNRQFISFLYNLANNFAQDQFISREPAGAEKIEQRTLSYPSMEKMKEE